ncbi:SIMPL domain-containing protein [Pseudaestuariivita rosea]|uniref:SIMPL domain-containing protein n=1 Tax=Pseudaestuariivita rosea TaxID=2763263 RepID=UPI001ABA49B3|nr:SIMPL domain-containing protein [Pseudaestuariivita rosea]
MRLLLILSFIALAIPAVAETERTITVQGQAEVSVTPDMATLQLGVISDGATASAALTENSETVAQMLSLLQENGVAAEDIQTSNLNLNPLYVRNSARQDQPPQISGYRVSNTVSVQVKDLDRLGDIIGIVTENGVNQFYGLNFGLRDSDVAMNQARQEAVADARARAELYVQAAGAAVGPVMSISEFIQQPVGPGPTMQMQSMERAAVPIAEGQMDIRATVTVVYSLAN